LEEKNVHVNQEKIDIKFFPDDGTKN
jgi:hypothetical protein